jgi:SAM-dependent methyltransferase
MGDRNRPQSVERKALPGRSKRGEKVRAVRCQVCGSTTEPGLDLGHQPVSDLILSRAQLARPETHYPMQLHHCATCGLTQLGYVINPAVVYKNFPFVSGTTQTATRHLQSLPRRLVEMLGLDGRSFAVDVGSNDGTLLEGWKPHGVRFLGVDPSGDPVRIANERGLTTWHAFFDEPTAERIVAEHGQADAITACGCFAHIADLDGVMRGIQKLLAPRGVFASDNQYWLDMVERLHYDNVFHQHLRYYALRPLQHLFQRYGLDVFDVERSEVYGGSIRVYGCRAGAHPVHERVRVLAEAEASARLYEPRTNAEFAARIEEKRWALQRAVHDWRARGKKLIGIGAPAKASTVCNYCRLGPESIEYVTEVNPLRIGMYLPGVRVPIVSEDSMFEDPRPADAAVLFSWNYEAEIMPKLRARGFRGEVLLP